MKKRPALPSQWVLPILTTAIILMAICLPERISALRDRSLFAAAHVEAYDSSLGISPRTMTLAQRLQAIAALNYGEMTDAYIRYEDSFSQEEIAEMDALFLTVAQDLLDRGVIRLPEGSDLSNMECYDCQRALLWDSVTTGDAAVVGLTYYDNKYNVGLNLYVDEESGLPVYLTMFYDGLNELFARGRLTVGEIAERFVEPFGFEIIEDGDDGAVAYIRMQTDEGELPYHVYLEYDMLTIAPVPSTVVIRLEQESNASMSVGASESASTEVYKK